MGLRKARQYRMRQISNILSNDKPIRFSILSLTFVLLVLFLFCYEFAAVIRNSDYSWLSSKELSSKGKGETTLLYPILIGVLVYLFRVSLTGWIDLRNRAHTLKGVDAYLSLTIEYILKGLNYGQNKESVNLNKVAEINEKIKLDFASKIKDNTNFMPFPIFDSSKGITFELIHDKYGFLHGDAVRLLVDFINKESYALAVMTRISDPGIKNFPIQRRTTIANEMFDSRIYWLESALLAKTEIDQVKNLRPIDWILNFLYLPRVMVCLFQLTLKH